MVWGGCFGFRPIHLKEGRMAKVKLTTALVGALSHAAGEEFECSADEAKRLIAAGFAVAIAEPKKETATKKAVIERR